MRGGRCVKLYFARPNELTGATDEPCVVTEAAGAGFDGGFCGRALRESGRKGASRKHRGHEKREERSGCPQSGPLILRK